MRNTRNRVMKVRPLSPVATFPPAREHSDWLKASETPLWPPDLILLLGYADVEPPAD